MQSHEIDYKIIGHDVQLVEVELDGPIRVPAFSIKFFQQVLA